MPGAASIAGIGVRVGGRIGGIKGVHRTGATDAGCRCLALRKRREIAPPVISPFAKVITADRIVYFRPCGRCQLNGACHSDQCRQGDDRSSHLSLRSRLVLVCRATGALLAETEFADVLVLLHGHGGEYPSDHTSIGCRSAKMPGAASIAGIGVRVGGRIAGIIGIHRTGAADAGRCCLALRKRREIAPPGISPPFTAKVTADRIVYFRPCGRYQLNGACHRDQCPQGDDRSSHLSLRSSLYSSVTQWAPGGARFAFWHLLGSHGRTRFKSVRSRVVYRLRP
jgi:hypothetical protein